MDVGLGDDINMSVLVPWVDLPKVYLIWAFLDLVTIYGVSFRWKYDILCRIKIRLRALLYHWVDSSDSSNSWLIWVKAEGERENEDIAKDGQLENKKRNSVTRQDVKWYRNKWKWGIFCEQYIGTM